MDLNSSSNWRKSDTDSFWKDIAPSEHVLQVYKNEGIFLDALAGFTSGGLNVGDAVIIIATDSHLKALDKKLTSSGIDTNDLIARNLYVPLDAYKVLEKFMVDNWPDEDLFMQTISAVIEKAQANNRRVRAFGEMVALLWADGHNGATVQLEYLWNKFCAQTSFCLFCAYPETGFSGDMNTTITHICNAHTTLVNGSDKVDSHETQYKTINTKAA